MMNAVDELFTNSPFDRYTVYINKIGMNEWMTPLFKINNNPNTRVVPSERKALLSIEALVNRI